MGSSVTPLAGGLMIVRPARYQSWTRAMAFLTASDWPAARSIAFISSSRLVAAASTMVTVAGLVSRSSIARSMLARASLNLARAVRAELTAAFGAAALGGPIATAPTSLPAGFAGDDAMAAGAF